MIEALTTTLLLLFFIVNAIQERCYRQRNIDTRGTIPIRKWLFVLGKTAMVLSWSSLLVQAYVADLRFIDGGMIPRCMALALEALGVTVVTLAYLHLGDGNQLGLTRPPIHLHTSGIYRISRNPVYIGFHLLTLAAVVYTLCPFVVLIGLASMAVHHGIVLAEETHLQRELGEVYEAYKRTTRRYV